MMKGMLILLSAAAMLSCAAATVVLDNPKNMNVTMKGKPGVKWNVRRSAAVPAKPNTWYRASVEIRTALKPGPGKLLFRVMQFGDKDKSLVFPTIASLQPSILDYTLYSGVFMTKPNSRTMRVYYNMSDLDGTASFRNLKLEELSEEEAQQIRASYQVPPAYFAPPVYAWEGEKELPWGYRVTATLLEKNRIPAQIAIRLPELKAEAAAAVKVNAETAEKLTLKQPLLKGKYTVIMTALDASGKEIAREKRTLRVIARPKSPVRLPVKTVEVDKDGNTIINGKPVLLNGVYHVYSEAEVGEVADAGFNTVIAWDRTPESYLKMLGWIAKYNLYADCVIKRSEPDKLNRLFKAIGNHPAIICYDPEDEPDIKDIKSEALQAKCGLIRKIFPGRPLRISCANANSVKRFGSCAEIICAHNYVIPFGGLAQQAKSTGTVAEAFPAPRKHSPQMTLQSWIHWHDPTRKPQTPEQTRSLAYIALIKGAKGLWWYSFVDKGSWDVRSVPSIWTTFKGLNAELNELAPLILTGKKTVLKNESAEPGILGALWESPERTVLVAVNPEKKAAEVQFSVSGKKAAELFADDAEYPVKSGKLKFELPAETTRIFELN